MRRNRRPSSNILDEIGTRNTSAGRIRFCAVLQIVLVAGFGIGLPSFLLVMFWFELRSFHLLWFPAGLALLALLRVVLGSRARCCICYQPVFLRRAAARNRNAPVLPLLGVHNTAAVYSLLGQSIRCPYCGRVNRLDGG